MELKNEEQFNNHVLKSTLPVLVDFWAPWCGPCHMVSPIVEELAAENVGKLDVHKMNVDEVPTVAQKYNIMSIPTLMVFKDGSAVDQIVGALPKNILEQKIIPHIR